MATKERLLVLHMKRGAICRIPFCGVFGSLSALARVRVKHSESSLYRLLCYFRNFAGLSHVYENVHHSAHCTGEKYIDNGVLF